MKAWAVATAAYLAAALMGLALPVPELGITSSLRPQLGPTGSGEWIEHPHIAVAGMALYYLATTWFKWWSSGNVQDG